MFRAFTDWLFGAGSRPSQEERLALLEARWDAANLGPATDNQELHWSSADSLGPIAAADAQTRQRLRDRSRYEFLNNNTYGVGILSTLCNDIIGTGPRPTIRNAQGEPANAIEQSWQQWTEETRFAEQLRLALQTRVAAGEVLARFRTVDELQHRVKLFVELLEPEVFDEDFTSLGEPRRLEGGEIILDGIEFRNGFPVAYHLRPHAGENFVSEERERVPADLCVHWFKRARPGQIRGIPESAPALPLFAYLRRFTLSVIASAETAADHAALMHTDQPMSRISEPNPNNWFKSIPLQKRSILTLPEGWKATQMKPEQPVTTYPAFKREILGEIGRTFSMPMNVSTADSSSHNYASARADFASYRTSITTERQDALLVFVKKVFRLWLREYLSLQSGIRADDLDEAIDTYRVVWTWPGFAYIDPVKQAQAAVALWDIGLYTDATHARETNQDLDTMRQELQDQGEFREAIDGPRPRLFTNATEDDSDPDDVA